MELLMKFYIKNHSHYHHLIPLTKRAVSVMPINIVLWNINSVPAHLLKNISALSYDHRLLLLYMITLELCLTLSCLSSVLPWVTILLSFWILVIISLICWKCAAFTIYKFRITGVCISPFSYLSSVFKSLFVI